MSNLPTYVDHLLGTGNRSSTERQQVIRRWLEHAGVVITATTHGMVEVVVPGVGMLITEPESIQCAVPLVMASRYQAKPPTDEYQKGYDAGFADGYNDGRTDRLGPDDTDQPLISRAAQVPG